MDIASYVIYVPLTESRNEHVGRPTENSAAFERASKRDDVDPV
jgi:hypothetical protein